MSASSVTWKRGKQAAVAAALVLSIAAPRELAAQTALVQQFHTLWWWPANVSLTTTKGDLLVIVARWQNAMSGQYQGAAVLNESQGNNCKVIGQGSATLPSVGNPGETVAEAWYCWNIKGGADQVWITGPTPGNGNNSELALTVDEFSGVDATADPLDTAATFLFPVQDNEYSGITTHTKDLIFNSWQDNDTNGWLDSVTFAKWPWVLLLDTSGPPGQDTGLGHAEAVLYDQPAGPDSTNWTTQDNARNSVVIIAGFRAAGQSGSQTPVAVAVSPAARSASVQQGGSAPSDNAAVTLTGTNASSTTWTATKKKSWITLTTASGTGSGTVAWSRNASGLTVGTYVDTITVTAPGAASGSPATVFDTLTVTAIPVTMAVSPGTRSVSAQQGTAAPSDNATVTLTGTNASSATWTATKKKSWTTLTTASGTGSGTVAWSRNTSGLTVGTYVDTITVTAPGAASGSPATVFDTLKITAAPVPIALAVSPPSRSASAQQGTAAPSDNATVTLTGDNASSTSWTATRKKSWTTLTTASGTGSGTVAWSRNATGLAVGTYVDTIAVTAPGAASGSPATVVDTLKITAASVPIVLAVSPASRSASAQQGTAAPSDNAMVTLTGDNASSTTWTATKKKSWTTLTVATGTGTATVAWSRNATGLAVGTYVDTITVTALGAASGSPGTVIDTLKITAAPVPVVLAVSPASRSASAQQGTAAPSDNATVTLTGDNASSTSWTPTKKKSWTSLTTASGTGSGTVAWSRNTTGLAVGIYVDTITVTAPGAASGSPATVVDTLKITAAPVPIILAVSPTSRSASVQQGTAAPSDNAMVTLTGDNASSTSWTATKKKSWTTLTIASGTGTATVAWSRNATGLAVGIYVDTITVTAPGAATGSPATVVDTLKINATATPVVLAVSPASRSASAQQGTAAPSDNAMVTLTGDNASSTTWAATRKKSWTTLTTASGTGTATVAWSRSTTGLAAGIYVDTITVTAPGAATGSPATVIDTLKITTAPVPIVMALGAASRHASAQQGSAAPGDNVTVTFTGTDASATAWSATRTAPWTTLTNAAGIGSGSVSWNRNATGLAVGTYVDTITVSAAAAGSPGLVIDTLQITAVPVPLVVAVAPTSRSVSVEQGSAAPGDNASVTLTGDNASSSTWTATHRKSWTTLIAASGTGSGTLSWTRNAAGLAAGTYVDTITVVATGAIGSPAALFDTLTVVAVAAPDNGLAIRPRGKRSRVLTSSSLPSILMPPVDSAVVGDDNDTTAVWVARALSPQLQVLTSTGRVNSSVSWSHLPVEMSVGLHIDTVLVSLQQDPNAQAIFVDTLEVVDVPAPDPQAAVSDLFSPGALTGDQRTMLDRTGNNNGSYDLGDFLAWVDRAQIQLSASMVERLQRLSAIKAAAAIPMIRPKLDPE